MKKTALMLAVIMLFTAIMPMQTHAATLITLPSNTTARVIEIIDVNAIRVRTSEGDALVRLIGIHPRGSLEARNFLAREIMGNYVTLQRDLNIPDTDRWNNMYVVFGNRLINSELILTGYGRLNEAHSAAQHFNQIQQGHVIARDAGLGVWAADLDPYNITRLGERLNINTATAHQFMHYFGATEAQAASILNFRTQAVFQHINDIKFVPGITWGFFATNRHRMTVSTNMNTANVYEISTLLDITQAQAQAIVNSRNHTAITDLQQLFARGLMGANQLTSNLPFISVNTVEAIQFANPNFRANINLATHPQMLRAGTSAIAASNIINQRTMGNMRNTLHNLGDVLGLPGLNFDQINALADNLRTHTNINTAPRSEIETLFGAENVPGLVDAIIRQRDFSDINQLIDIVGEERFARMEPFIYVTREIPALTNINTASEAQLIELGFSANEAWQIRHRRPPLNQILGWMNQEMLDNSTQRTNINTAPAGELLTLSERMNEDIITRIVHYRNNQPFGSIEEVEEFFVSINQWEMFLQFRAFIIVR